MKNIKTKKGLQTKNIREIWNLKKLKITQRLLLRVENKFESFWGNPNMHKMRLIRVGRVVLNPPILNTRPLRIHNLMNLMVVRSLVGLRGKICRVKMFRYRLISPAIIPVLRRKISLRGPIDLRHRWGTCWTMEEVIRWASISNQEGKHPMTIPPNPMGSHPRNCCSRSTMPALTT